MIRLMVVDDHAIVRRGLVRVVETAPDIELVGTAANGIEALHLLTRSRPDVVLMDIGMPVLDGVGATRLIVDHDPQVRVVVLTGSADDRVSEALEATERTVKAHLHRVFRVLGATDRVQAALRGREHLARAGS
jgi:DNA-binding NarL/FixJ family response regulator